MTSTRCRDSNIVIRETVTAYHVLSTVHVVKRNEETNNPLADIVAKIMESRTSHSIRYMQDSEKEIIKRAEEL
jgi:hypothetical protein